MAADVSTSVTLLARVRRRDDQAAWRRFAALYTPLLFRWAQRAGLNASDAADLAQEVLLVLLRELPRFEYDASRSFRAWLKTITVNKCREHQRRRKPAGSSGDAAAEIPAVASLEEFWDDEYRQYLVQKALEIMQAEFEPTTWRACWARLHFSRVNYPLLARTSSNRSQSDQGWPGPIRATGWHNGTWR